MLSTLTFIFVVVIGYLVGSICSAIIVSELFSLPDPRTLGSQNPGATNVLRLAGKKYAAIVLLSDILKGFLPVLLAKMLDAGPLAVSLTCLAAVIGHIYPVYFKFQGGKGVATAIGALLGLHFLLGTVVIATWLLIANLSGYSSLASLISMALAVGGVFFIPEGLIKLPAVFCISVLVIYQHRKNMLRLVAGKEPKIKMNKNLDS